MTTTPRYRLMFTLLFAAFALSACGRGSESPVALSTVTPEDGGQPSTLLAAATYQGVPAALSTAAMAKYDQFKSRVKNPDYITMIDFTVSSAHDRFYMINVKTGKVDAIPVAHGLGSDPKATGVAHYFSNRNGSKMTSLGAYLISERFQSSKHGTALRLDGLESTNSNARARAILIHSATYVREGLSKQGMSWGCAAVPLNWISTVISRLANGSFMYAYGPSQSPAMLETADFLDGNALNPAAGYLDEGDGAPVDGEWGPSY